MEALKAALPFVLLLVLFWLLVIRPTQRRQKALNLMRSRLKVGDRVILTSGIYGTIVAIDGDKTRLSLSEGVEVTVASAAIGSVEAASVEAPEEH